MPSQDTSKKDASDLLQQAIQKARMGHELAESEMFLDVVHLDPENELAWVWLIGLLDPLEDRIAACERVLSINPDNLAVRVQYENLVKKRDHYKLSWQQKCEDDYREASNLATKGMVDEALSVISQMLLRNDSHEAGWLLYADLTFDADNKIRAYKRVLDINPSSVKARDELERLRHFKDNPVDLAVYYEEEGHLQEALDIYCALAYHANGAEFDKIYKQVVRLEDLKSEKIRYIPSSVTVARLSAGVPLLYIVMVLLHEGLQPLKFPAPHLWIGIPWAMLGGFFVALASVRSRHVIWCKLFNDQGRGGSKGARPLVMLTGWVLVILPFLILLWDSYVRLLNFVPPPFPYF